MLDAASIAAIASGILGRYPATRSPGPTPSASNACERRETRSRSPARLTFRLRPILAAEDQRRPGIAPAQQVLGEVEPGLGEPARAGHLLAVGEHGPAPGLGDDAAKLPDLAPERLPVLHRPAVQRRIVVERPARGAPPAPRGSGLGWHPGCAPRRASTASRTRGEVSFKGAAISRGWAARVKPGVPQCHPGHRRRPASLGPGSPLRSGRGDMRRMAGRCDDGRVRVKRQIGPPHDRTPMSPRTKRSGDPGPRASDPGQVRGRPG